MANPIAIDTNIDVKAQIIGGGIVAQKLKNFLANQQVFVYLAASQDEINPSQGADYIFWFVELTYPHPKDLLINLAKNLQSKLIIIFLESPIDKNLLNQLIDRQLDVCQINIFHLYGPKLTSFPLSILWSKIKHGLLPLPENDQLLVTPLYLDDALEAICRIAFSTQTFAHSYVLLGKEKITLLSLSFRLREIVMEITGKTLKIIPSPPSTSLSELKVADFTASLDTQKQLKWKPHTLLLSGLSKAVISTIPAEPLVSSVEPDRNPGIGWAKGNKNIKKKISRLQKRNILKKFFILIFFLIIIISPFFLTQLFDWQIKRLLKHQSQLVSEGKIAQASSLQNRLEKTISLGQGTAWIIGRDWQKELSLTKVYSQLAQITDNTAKLTDFWLGNISDTPRSSLNKINHDVDYLLQQPIQFEARSLLGRYRELLPIAPWLLGLDQKRTFLILVQNASELRPTGGFLTSIGFLVIDKGRLLDINFVDTYQLDANLVGEQSSPAPIYKYLNEEKLLIRDANWYPDLRQSADIIGDLVFRATGRKTDGVIFINSYALKYILEKTGPVIIPAGIEINSQNILERATFSSTAQVDNGSHLDILAETILGLQKYAKTHPEQIKVLRGLFSAIEHQELFFISHDQNIAQILATQNLDGQIAESTCPAQFISLSCLNDSLLISEANLGVNMADYFLTRKRDLKISLLPGNIIDTTLELYFQNNSPASPRPGGTYKGYIRLFIPEKAKVKSVFESQSQDLVQLETDIQKEKDKTILGFYIEIPPSSQKTFLVSFEKPSAKFSATETTGYNLLLQKQPGNIVPSIVTLTFPQNLTPLVISQKAISTPGSLTFQIPGDISQNIAVEFASML